MTTTETTAFEGYCQAHRHDEPCEDCAAEDREFKHMRADAARLVSGAEEAERLLSSLEVTFENVVAHYAYEEFYRVTMDDRDARAALRDARRAVRSFARIARERATRTEQEP